MMCVDGWLVWVNGAREEASCVWHSFRGPQMLTTNVILFQNTGRQAPDGLQRRQVKCEMCIVQCVLKKFA